MSSPWFRRGAVLPLLAACVAATGCATLRREPVTALPVVFAGSSRPFTIEPGPGPDATGAATSCVVRRAEVQLREVRGDTVFFTALRSHTPARGAATCGWRGPGYIALGGQPHIRSEMPQFSAGLTLAVAASVVPMIVLFGFGFIGLVGVFN